MKYVKYDALFFLNRSFERIIIIIIILLKNVGSARLRESDVHPISPKTPAIQYQPIDRKKRKGKRVEDYSRDSQLRPIMMH